MGASTRYFPSSGTISNMMMMMVMAEIDNNDRCRCCTGVVHSSSITAVLVAFMGLVACWLCHKHVLITSSRRKGVLLLLLLEDGRTQQQQQCHIRMIPQLGAVSVTTDSSTSRPHNYIQKSLAPAALEFGMWNHFTLVVQ